MTSYTIRVVDQAASLLKAVAEHPDQGASQLAETSGLTRTLAFRILATLESQGLVAKDASRKTYRLGREAVLLGARAREQSSLLQAAGPILDTLAAETGETVSLVVRDGLSAVYLAVRESPYPTRLFAQAGRRGALHVGAGGKVLLAFAPLEVQQAVLSAPLAAFTPATVTDPEQLAGVLAEIRSTGLSERFGDLDNHSFGLGAPVRDASGVIAALSIAGPTSRFTSERGLVYRDLVRVQAARLSRELGGWLAPSGSVCPQEGVAWHQTA